MSQKKSKTGDDVSPGKISKKGILAIGIVLIIGIAIIAGVVLMQQGPIVQNAPANTSGNVSENFTSAGELYSKSVDFANAGNYKAALEAADAALAKNVSSLNPLIQSNRAGILVMLGRNNEAIVAADEAINAPGNLTSLRSIAYYNKGNALMAEGRTIEADAAYANATALDPTLKHP
ncbi:MAG TPA: hypothetical protein PKM50_07735 [Methanoregula sp.]|nr:hypothetical protein [Methanoregula sp.]